jgi:dihydrofolate reductase
VNVRAWPTAGPTATPRSSLNNAPKFVVSTTLDTVEWQNSTPIRGNVAEESTRLKRQPGKNVTIIGSGALVQSLLRDDPTYELQLMIPPIVIGSRKRLFEDGSDQNFLKLVGWKTFSTGVVSLTYQPAGKEVEG